MLDQLVLLKRHISAIWCTLLLLGSLGGCAPTSPSDSDAPRGTPTEQGIAIALSIEEQIPSEDTAIKDVLPLSEGPEGSLFGLELEGGKRIFALGETLGEEVLITGTVIEDETGALLLRQDNRDNGVTITLSTGDAFDIEIVPPGLRVTFTLAGTVPASTVVVNVDENGAVVDESSTFLREVLNEDYAYARVREPRTTMSTKIRPFLQANNDCPWLESVNNGFDAICLAWNVISVRAPQEALKAMCLGVDLFIEGYRGSYPYSTQDEIRSRLLAAFKIAMAMSCEFLDNIWKVGKLVKKLSVPDAVCLLKSFGDELSRFTTDDGVALNDALCELVYGTTCDNTCTLSDNGQCDDGRTGSATNFCQLGTDCRDCGATGGSAPEGPLGCAGDGVCNIECPSATLDPDCTALEICVAIMYCCPNDGVCDAVYCPRGFEDDPDCADGSDCEFCCPNDGICDIATCPSADFESDPDCTNAHYCDRLQVCCDDDRCDSPAFPCPEGDYDCGFCGVLDDVCIAECSPPDPDCPESGVELGDINGYVVHAVTGASLPGAIVTVVDSGQSGTTDATGAFLIENVPAGSNTLSVALVGFITATVPVTVMADGLVSTTIGLVPMTENDQRITAVLSWSDEPSDLDLHLSGPKADGSRFHLSYFNTMPVTYACLDLDDTSSFGPETATISALSDGTYVAGSYHLWIHNYSSTPEFNVSSATVTLFAGGVQIAQYLVSNAIGVSDLDIWLVVNFDVSTSGAVTLSDILQTFAIGDQNSEF